MDFFRATTGIPVVQSFTPFHNYEIKLSESLDIIEFTGTRSMYDFPQLLSPTIDLNLRLIHNTNNITRGEEEVRINECLEEG